MDTTPRISVVIPTFNCGAFISGAIRSAVEQHYDNLEIIVVDDSSSDNTQQIVLREWPTAIYLRNQSNRGVSFARNRGIERATGDFVAFLDADDEWLPRKLARQASIFHRHPELVALSGEMIPWDAAYTDSTKEPETRLVSLEDMIVRNRFRTPTVMVRADVLRTVGSFREDLVICEDFDLWLRLARAGPLMQVSEPYSRFRARTNGLSAGNRAKTYGLDRKYMESLLELHRQDRRLRRLVYRGISSRALERAIEQCDQQGEFAGALLRTIESCMFWPWSDPTGAGHLFIRARRTRRIILDWIKYSYLKNKPSRTVSELTP